MEVASNKTNLLCRMTHVREDGELVTDELHVFWMVLQEVDEFCRWNLTDADPVDGSEEWKAVKYCTHTHRDLIRAVFD